MLIGTTKSEEDLDSDCEELRGCLKMAEKSQKESRESLAGEHKVISYKMMQMFAVIRDCFLSFRWNDAFRVLRSVIRHPIMRNGLTVLRLTFELFDKLSLQLTDNNNSLITLSSKLSLLSDIRVKQISLDQFLLSAAQLPDKVDWNSALLQLKAAISYSKDTDKSKRRSMRSKWDEMVENCLIFGYGAMILYSECILRRQALSSWMNGQESVEELVQVLVSTVDSAIQGFDEFNSKCKNEPGCWDIFFSKHVELLEYKSQLIPNEKSACLEKAEKVLKNYVNQHPLNPNAWRLLYDFYCRNAYDREEHIRVLQELCTFVPSDKLVLELCKSSSDGKLLQRRKSNPIVILFNYLDYNQFDSSAWQMFAEILVTHSTQSPDTGDYAFVVDSIRDCWLEENRCSWWPAYQFSLTWPEDMSNEEFEILSFKAVVARFLLGTKNEFTSKVKSTLRKLPHKFYGSTFLKQVKHLPSLFPL